MAVNAPTTSNITNSIEKLTWYTKMLGRSLYLLFESGNRALRRQKLVSPGDALFNFIKLTFLRLTILKYRFAVRFGDSMVMDSTFPPFPSRAFDKRLSNYLNNLDLTELPS